MKSKVSIKNFFYKIILTHRIVYSHRAIIIKNYKKYENNFVVLKNVFIFAIITVNYIKTEC